MNNGDGGAWATPMASRNPAGPAVSQTHNRPSSAAPRIADLSELVKSSYYG